MITYSDLWGNEVKEKSKEERDKRKSDEDDDCVLLEVEKTTGGEGQGKTGLDGESRCP